MKRIDGRDFMSVQRDKAVGQANLAAEYMTKVEQDMMSARDCVEFVEDFRDEILAMLHRAYDLGRENIETIDKLRRKRNP